MQLFELSDVYCLRSNHRFSLSDVGVMEEDEVPICDTCIYAMCDIKVQYDGSQDLLDFLKAEISGNRCTYCYEESTELLHIEYGNPVDGRVKCLSCDTMALVDIHIEFI